jgi:hypothetical protein
MPRILGFLLAAATAALMASCAGDQQDDPNRVSTIPWNRPEKWEGQGPMGGMMPGTQ